MKHGGGSIRLSVTLSLLVASLTNPWSLMGRHFVVATYYFHFVTTDVMVLSKMFKVGTFFLNLNNWNFSRTCFDDSLHDSVCLDVYIGVF